MHFDVYYIGLEKMMRRCELQGQIQVASASDQTSDDMPLPRWSFQQIHNFFLCFISKLELTEKEEFSNNFSVAFQVGTFKL